MHFFVIIAEWWLYLFRPGIGICALCCYVLTYFFIQLSNPGLEQCSVGIVSTNSIDKYQVFRPVNKSWFRILGSSGSHCILSGFTPLSITYLCGTSSVALNRSMLVLVTAPLTPDFNSCGSPYWWMLDPNTEKSRANNHGWQSWGRYLKASRLSRWYNLLGYDLESPRTLNLQQTRDQELYYC